MSHRFSRSVLEIDAASHVRAIERTLREWIPGHLRRRGVVVGLSGGIDSSVVGALCARALGGDRVLGLLMPDRDSSAESQGLACLLAAHFRIRTVVENITPILEAAGCYRRQAAAVASLFPEYDDRYRCKISLPSILDGDRLNISHLTIESPEGERKSARMPLRVYLQVVAATNFKQRTRAMVEYYHADRVNYAVAGTPNRLEYDQGFFVKHGDGAADVKPIAHLYKTQVYALAEYMGVPEPILRRPPTTDTFSLPQSQEEFYFSLPYREMDLCLYARNHSVPAPEAARVLGLTVRQVERVYRDIEQKRRTTAYLHARPMLVEDVPEVGG